jgi:hypothetical protein
MAMSVRDVVTWTNMIFVFVFVFVFNHQLMKMFEVYEAHARTRHTDQHQ